MTTQLSDYAIERWQNSEEVAGRAFKRVAYLESGCVIWTGAKMSAGYGEMQCEGRLELAHRLFWMLLVGEIPEGKHVLHRCDNPPCVRIDHLFIGKPLDNALDKVAKGRDNSPRGEQANFAKLTAAQVLEARSRFVPWSRVHGVAPLAREFGLSETAMRDVLYRRHWRHV